MKRKLIGSISLLIGIVLILNSFSGITGFAIAQEISTTPSFIFGLILFLGGLVLLASDRRESKEGGLENRAQRILKSGARLSTKKLKKLARQMGYEGRDAGREGYRIFKPDGTILTDIPKHNGDLPDGTYYSILTALATGESSFRKRNYEH